MRTKTIAFGLLVWCKYPLAQPTLHMLEYWPVGEEDPCLECDTGHRDLGDRLLHPIRDLIWRSLPLLLVSTIIWPA